MQNHTGQGDNVAGPKYEVHKHKGQPENLLVALKEFEDQIKDDEDAIDFIDELSDYLADYPERNVVGLEAKLKQAGMDPLLDEAIILKERFVKKLYRGQLSLKSQTLYAQLLSLVNTYFSHKIKPLIRDGAPTAIVEESLLEEVFLPVFSNVSGVDMSITIDHIRGMLYFLTGKCHIKWS